MSPVGPKRHSQPDWESSNKSNSSVGSHYLMITVNLEPVCILYPGLSWFILVIISCFVFNYYLEFSACFGFERIFSYGFEFCDLSFKINITIQTKPEDVKEQIYFKTIVRG